MFNFWLYSNLFIYPNRILVRIDSWEVDSQYPNGHFVRSLGKIGELETEVTAVLIHHGITNATPFSEAQVMNERNIVKQHG